MSDISPMSGSQDEIIPLSDADAVLVAFGVGPANKAYQRWRTEYGFRMVDFADVLDESHFVLNVDWREWLQDAVDQILTQLATIGVAAEADLGDDGERGEFAADGRREAIKFVPSDDDNFDQVIRSVNSVIQAKGQYRKLRYSEGTDGWSYGLLPCESWKELESKAGATVDLLFMSNF